MSDYPKQDGPVLIIEVESHKYFLRYGMSLTVGRSNTNDIILNDPTVSRAHALFRWDSKFPLILDRGSTSGICVDDVYVSYKHLQGLHSVKLGSIYIRVDLAESEIECPTQLEISNKFNRDALLEDLNDSNEVTLFGERGSKDVVGYLADNEALRKLLIHLEMSRRTGTLSITESSITGIIKYGLGKIRSAQCGKHINHAALQRICGFSGGSFHFTINVDVGEANLCVSPMCYFRSLTKMLTKKIPKQDTPFINSHDLDESSDC
jgi:FHA domain